MNFLNSIFDFLKNKFRKNKFNNKLINVYESPSEIMNSQRTTFDKNITRPIPQYQEYPERKQTEKEKLQLIKIYEEKVKFHEKIGNAWAARTAKKNLQLIKRTLN